MQKILFIEDDPMFQKNLGDFLKGEGFDVVLARDGEEGLLFVKNTSPDLILLDLVLPKKDGFGVLEEIKQDAQLAKIPVIVLTNLESSQDIGRVFAGGAMAYLVKADYSLSDITEKVKEILRTSKEV